MKNNLNMGISGILTIKEFCKETGDLLDQYTDANVITEQGVNTLFLRMALGDPDNLMKFDHFTLGIDDGSQEEPSESWGLLNPKPALKRYTSLNQLGIYDVPHSSMVFDYPEKNTFQAATLLDGQFILDTYFPGDVDMRYTSATLRFDNSTTFSYKRFPVRSLSRLIDVQIIWTFRFVNEYDYLCPVPPYEAERRFYSADGSLSYYMLDDLSITQETVDGHSNVRLVQAQPNGDVVFIKGDKNIARIDESGASILDLPINTPNRVIVLDVDVNNVSYVGTDNTNGTVVKLDNNGSVIWTVTLSDGSINKTVSSIWVINNSRIAVVTKDDGNFTPGQSGNMIHILNATDGTVIYTTTIANSQGRTGYLDFISSSGGEFFAIQKEQQSGDDSSLIKLAFDLSEINRVDLPGEVKSIFADHNNEILIGYSMGSGSTIARYDADLNYIWRQDTSGGSGYEFISVDRDAIVYAAASNKIDIFDTDLDLIATESFSGSSGMSVVGRKWSYFS